MFIWLSLKTLKSENRKLQNANYKIQIASNFGMPDQ